MGSGKHRPTRDTADQLSNRSGRIGHAPHYKLMGTPLTSVSWQASAFVCSFHLHFMGQLVKLTDVLDNTAAIWKAFVQSPGLRLIAGPCVIESLRLCMTVASALRDTCQQLGICFVFKASFDKANRTSDKSFRGPGVQKGLAVLRRVRAEIGVPVLTDVHTEDQARLAAEVVDFLQIPAFLCRQTDLIQAAVRTGKIVNLKKGQFLSPWEMEQVLQKAARAGGRKLVITERGTTFGYNNLVSDMRAIPIMRQWGYPVLFDATHSVQAPGGAGDRSGGHREFAPVLARCAVAAGADGLFIETHPDPDQALSDGPNMVPLNDVPKLLAGLVRIRKAIDDVD
jgi:2-dehydro-3-deoxyphosphooctonate aldolase (KDO 8-P synthase)